jgi:ubiquinone/menaquinone biosynthesis C-methylase UbiE
VERTRVDTRQLRKKYRGFARWYDLAEGLPEVLGLRRLRRRLLAQAKGRVLEVAAGTGKNFRWYPPGETAVAVDLSIDMLRRAQQRAENLKRRHFLFAVMDAGQLAFREDSFDCVVSTLSTCTFPDPVQALREMARVCRADGRILLVEHGRSDQAWAARYQDRRATAHAQLLGCHWNREPLDLVRQAGLRVNQADRRFLGVFHTIEARPT